MNQLSEDKDDLVIRASKRHYKSIVDIRSAGTAVHINITIIEIMKKPHHLGG